MALGAILLDYSTAHCPEILTVRDGVLGATLREAEKEQRALISAALNKTIKDDRDALIDHVPTLPRDCHLGSSDSRLYVDEAGYFPPGLVKVKNVGRRLRVKNGYVAPNVANLSGWWYFTAPACREVTRIAHFSLKRFQLHTLGNQYCDG